MKSVAPINNNLTLYRNCIVVLIVMITAFVGSGCWHSAADKTRDFNSDSKSSVAAQPFDGNSHQIYGAVNGWEAAVRKRDLDYAIKEPLVLSRLAELKNSNPPSTIEEAIVLAEQAYEEANQKFKDREESDPPRDGFRSVWITSEPSGARVEINGRSIGSTPCKVLIPSNYNGTFDLPTEVRAMPMRPGEFTQFKTFRGGAAHPDGTEWKGNTLRSDSAEARVATRIPDRIFFDMKVNPTGGK
jgi:hypothetical protein